MMNGKDLENWVLEQGGPAIQLKMCYVQTKTHQRMTFENFISKLLNIEEVNTSFELP